MGLLKRKRSDSEVSMTSSQFSSPPRPNDSSIATLAMMEGDMMMTSPSRTRAANPSHLNSRTLKRFRDNRPSDEEVHRKFYEWRAHHQNPPASLPSPTELDVKLDSSSHGTPAAGHTLERLYAAQQKHNSVTSIFGQPSVGVLAQSQSILPAPTVQTPQIDTKQASLHRFFNIATPPPSSISSLPPTLEPRTCEDCGVGLGVSGDDAVMDVDGFGFAQSGASCGCVSCGKLVCSHCSVSNMGEQRQCLVCAGNKVWIGGIGWTERRVAVC